MYIFKHPVRHAIYPHLVIATTFVKMLAISQANQFMDIV